MRKRTRFWSRVHANWCNSTRFVWALLSKLWTKKYFSQKQEVVGKCQLTKSLQKWTKEILKSCRCRVICKNIRIKSSWVVDHGESSLHRVTTFCQLNSNPAFSLLAFNRAKRKSCTELCTVVQKKMSGVQMNSIRPPRLRNIIVPTQAKKLSPGHLKSIHLVTRIKWNFFHKK